MAPILLLNDIHLTFGGTPLLSGATLSIQPGERVCLVGRNGSGKSTLLKVAAGLVEADHGERFVQPGTTIRYLSQEPDFSGFIDALSYAQSGLAPGDDPYRARMLLADLGISEELKLASASGGEARRVALAQVLAPEPDLILLDEPTNHLDLPTIEWLEKTLSSGRSAFALISHDRRFLSNLSRATVWLDRGITRRIERGFAQFEAWRDDIYEQEERDAHKLDRKIVMEEHWVRYGVTARRKRNMRRMGELDSLREKRRTARHATGTARIVASESDNAGTLIVEAESLSKSFGTRPIVKDLSLRIHRGDRIGIVGPNGAGKTTLVSLLLGLTQPDDGRVRLGTNLEIASLEQSRASLDPETSVAETLTGGRSDSVIVNGEARHVIGYLKDFLFSPEQARTPVRALSGGERGRLLLARALLTSSNVLVLDEPTNDLDIETLDVLQDMLAAYGGTIILISHDRDFLDRVVDRVIVPDGDGRWSAYAGGYADMLAQRRSITPSASNDKGKPRKAAPAETSEGSAAAGETRKKLSFKDKHALEQLPKEMAALEAVIARHKDALADAALYVRDRAAFDRHSAALTEAQAKLAAAEERWLELEMLREAMEAG